MGRKASDLTGMRFGKLLVIERAENTPQNKARWKCLCDCGNYKIVRASDLKAGYTNSCGCLFSEGRKKAIAKITGEKSHLYKHGMSNARINKIYRAIKDRCYRSNCAAYASYGGRGIKMCDEWKDDFITFYKWAMNNGYNDDLTIDRIDVNGDYCPENCRWVSHKIQQNNRTNNVRVTIDGITRTISEWCEIKGISKKAVYHRYERGLRGEDLFSPVSTTGRRCR